MDSILPFLRTPIFAPTATASGCYQRRMHATQPRKLCLISGPIAAMRDFGGVGELPEAKPSLYELLGIPTSGSYDDIKRAYKSLARKYHPDVSPPDRAVEYTRRFIEVKEAYDTLSDSSHRALYDRHLACGLQLAFSTIQKKTEHKTWWRNRCEEQLAELSRKRMRKNSDEILSWGARMRGRSKSSTF